MGKTLYLECCSGISGDMTVAALLGLGADWETLKRAVDSLSVEGFEIDRKRVQKSGISAWDFEVRLDREHENHDHDMAYLHGAANGKDPEAVQGQEHGDSRHPSEGRAYADAQEHSREHADSQEQEHSREHAHGHHPHRGMKEIREIIGSGSLTERARGTALRIFEILAQAEAKAHQVPVEEVHFHEVGAVDSIVDIVAAAVCLDNLDITEVIVPELYEGKGWVRCQHGLLPIPVPAVTNIAQEYGLRLHRTDVQGELVTPTGAAIAAAVRTSERLPESFTVEKTGVGAGKRQYNCPGILRAMLIAPVQKKNEMDAWDAGLPESTEETLFRSGKKTDFYDEDVIWKLETNVDDCTGEMLGFCMERLFAAGARDVHYTPVFMKKNRPGWLITVLCCQEDIGTMERILFSETTTIGIRRVKMQRSVLKRRQQTVQTPCGEVGVKVCGGADGEEFYPEYESLAALCREKGISYREACRMTTLAAAEAETPKPADL